MVANYYTLRHIAIQLNRQLKGWFVREVFSQNKNEVILSFEAPHDRTEQSNRSFLVVRCEPAENGVFLMESFPRAKRNSVNLVQQIVGLQIQSVSIDSADRQITIETQYRFRLIIQMFGSKANVLLVEGNDQIVDSFLRPKEMVGQSLSGRQNREPVPNGGAFSMRLREFGEISIGVAIKKFFPLFGGILLTELFHRAGIARSETVDRLSEDEIQRLFMEGKLMVHELESTCKPRIYYGGTNPVAFSIIELHHCKQYERREFATPSEAIRIFFGSMKSLDHAARDKARIHQGLKKELDRISRTLAKISEETELANRAGEYEMMGELLKAHLHEVHKGSTEVILENTLDGSNELVTVPLDRNLTPAKNADRFFERAKKSRIAVTEQKKQKTRLTDEKHAVTAMLGKLETLVSSAEIDIFLKEHYDLFRSLDLVKAVHTKKAVEEDVPFRVFRVAGDFVVWAGKSGENNDLLSTRHTKSKDLWFHARSVGGSHVVLKFGTGKGEVSKRAIDEAAAIAAYYSKMKNSKLVPVSVCEGKYVRKAKGAPAGTVTIDREKVIFVEPRLPQEQ